MWSIKLLYFDRFTKVFQFYGFHGEILKIELAFDSHPQTESNTIQLLELFEQVIVEKRSIFQCLDKKFVRIV